MTPSFKYFAAVIGLSSLIFYSSSQTLPDARPELADRTFQSTAIDSLINTLVPLMKNPDLGVLLSNCLPSTLDTTVSYHTPMEEAANGADLDSFIITGDINALWLRDSANQVIPYLPYGPIDQSLVYLFEGLIARQANSINIDPFCNSFNFNASGDGHQYDSVKPAMTKAVFECKYEIDSPSAFLKLSFWHWRYSGDEALVRFANEAWKEAIKGVLDTIEIMQVNSGSDDSPYMFTRETSAALDTTMLYGRGPPAKPNGLSRSVFRPSDDAVTFPYNIPGNAMACTELKHAALMLHQLADLAATGDIGGASSSEWKVLHARALKVGGGVCATLREMIDVRSVGRDGASSLPYEIDGYGNQYIMDDANVPSLLSLPSIGFLSAGNPVYQATRAYVLSEKNPYFFSGVDAKGIGGPHVGYHYAWPMAIVTQAMTSDNDEEIVECLEMLVKSSAGTGFMHESFNVDNVKDYTRSWFAWANGYLGELILQIIYERPHLVINEDSIETAQAAVRTPVCVLAQRETVVPATTIFDAAVN